MGRCRAKGYENIIVTVQVGIVAKYLDNEDTYMSVIRSPQSAAWHTGGRPRVQWVSAEHIETDGTAMLEQVDGILVPGGFGARGVEGKDHGRNLCLTHKNLISACVLVCRSPVIAAARLV